MREFPRARLAAYGVAVLATGASLLIRVSLQQWFGYHAELMTFLPAIIFSAYLGGLGPGLLATLLGAIAGDYFFLEPQSSPALADPGTAYGLGLFVLTGVVISGLTESLHRSRRRIAASERRHAVTLASIGDAVIATDTQARVTYLNPAAEALTGWPSADAVGRPLGLVFRIINEKTREPVEDPAATVLRSGAAVGLPDNSALQTRGGDVLPVDDSGAPIIDDGGGLVGVVLVFRDVTERRRAEESEAFRRSEQRWRSLTEALPQLVWSATPDGTCDYFSTQWTEHTGISEGDLLGWRWLETLHPEDREPTRRLWLESVAGDHPYDVEYRVRHRDGEYRWFKTRGTPIRDDGGVVLKWFGTCTDITDLRRAEEALRESEERFRGTFESAAVGIAHTDLDGRWLRLNQTLAAILGYTVEETLQRRWQDLTHPEDVPASVEEFAALLRDERPSYLLEKRYVRKDGSVIWGHLAVSLQRDAAGKPAYAIVVIQDVSERKRLENELRHAKETAEAANRAKDEFLANVSHEIRTPMNAILGMTELALESDLSEDQRQCLNTVKSAADNLLIVINDLLDFAKIEAGKLELDSADFHLRSAVGDTVRALALRAHKKGLELVCHVEANVPDALVGDAGRLRQILLNLVGNAIKFTDHGEVVVRVKLASSESSETAHPSPLTTPLHFSVTDTGIGIPRDKQEHIFRAFEQEDTSTTRKYGGTGLGLSIASRLIALMGGTIAVESEPGRGSTFTFTARFGRQPHPKESAGGRPAGRPTSDSLRGLRVLVVDDNATNRHILEGWLRGWQMEPSVARDGLAGLSALWRAISLGRPCPLVLLDARMPDADGLELAARVREHPELAATRIILLTSGDRHGDVARARELRIDAHLLKPVQQDELLETIYRVMSWSARDVPSVQSSAKPLVPAVVPLRVLVAEDNEFNVRHLEQVLTRRGHHVRVANNGREALAMLGIDDRGQSTDDREASDRSPVLCPLSSDFDLLLLDLHMPELDGLQVIRAIRDYERSAGGHLPVIALTARARQEDRERCLAAGMDDYLTKPLQAAELFAAIERLIPPGRASHPDSDVDRSLLAPAVLLAACDGDPEALRARCEDFRTYLPDRLAEASAALQAGDAPRLREAAHKLCGLLSVFSTIAAAVASDLEDQAAEGRLAESRLLFQKMAAMAGDLLRQVDGLSIEALRGQAAADTRS